MLSVFEWQYSVPYNGSHSHPPYTLLRSSFNPDDITAASGEVISHRAFRFQRSLAPTSFGAGRKNVQSFMTPFGLGEDLHCVDRGAECGRWLACSHARNITDVGRWYSA